VALEFFVELLGSLKPVCRSGASAPSIREQPDKINYQLKITNYDFECITFFIRN
jgi:hypothetical protein